MLKLLPFRFKEINNKILITNEIGQFEFISQQNFNKLIKHPELLNEEILYNLINKFFICDNKYYEDTINELAIKLRTKKDFLNYFTSLHIIVLTHNCNSNCTYCHASSNSKTLNNQLNMSIKTAKKIFVYNNTIIK